jgi:hypothetical protein
MLVGQMVNVSVSDMHLWGILSVFFIMVKETVE